MKIGTKVLAKGRYEGTLDHTFISWRKKKVYLVKLDDGFGCIVCLKYSDLKRRK